MILQSKGEIGKSNRIKLKIKNEMWCAADNHNNLRHPCAKGFLELTLKKVIKKILNFHKNCPNLTDSHK